MQRRRSEPREYILKVHLGLDERVELLRLALLEGKPEAEIARLALATYLGASRATTFAPAANVRRSA